jgi:prepilin-type N-terminal cleavage/methylation domain-containing protein
MKLGFSLVELSIVLVILGLLTGGILAGQSLIRAAELRSVTSDTARYQTAFFTFRDKYFALPGDMRNAVKFWGAPAAAPLTTDGMNAACRDLLASGVGTQTCNGDGDGTVSFDSTEHYESYRAWQHLANAGLIEGSYTGVTAGAVPNSFGPSLGVNLPRGKMSNTGFTARAYPVANAADPSYFAGSYGNMMWFGAQGVSYTSAVALKGEEAWNLDVKLMVSHRVV